MAFDFMRRHKGKEFRQQLQTINDAVFGGGGEGGFEVEVDFDTYANLDTDESYTTANGVMYRMGDLRVLNITGVVKTGWGDYVQGEWLLRGSKSLADVDQLADGYSEQNVPEASFGLKGDAQIGDNSALYASACGMSGNAKVLADSTLQYSIDVETQAWSCNDDIEFSATLIYKAKSSSEGN